MKVFFILLWYIPHYFSFVECLDDSQQKFNKLKSQFDTLRVEGKVFTPEVLFLAIQIKNAMENFENSKKTSVQLNMFKRQLPLSVQSMIWPENLFSIENTKWKFEIINDKEIRMKVNEMGKNLTEGTESICVMRMIPEGEIF